MIAQKNRHIRDIQDVANVAKSFHGIDSEEATKVAIVLAQELLRIGHFHVILEMRIAKYGDHRDEC